MVNGEHCLFCHARRRVLIAEVRASVQGLTFVPVVPQLQHYLW